MSLISSATCTYDHPDMVELYPGLFVEEAKGRMNPGSEACPAAPPHTMGRAVLSDAVTLGLTGSTPWYELPLLLSLSPTGG